MILSCKILSIQWVKKRPVWVIILLDCGTVQQLYLLEILEKDGLMKHFPI